MQRGVAPRLHHASVRVQHVSVHMQSCELQRETACTAADMEWRCGVWSAGLDATVLGRRSSPTGRDLNFGLQACVLRAALQPALMCYVVFAFRSFSTTRCFHHAGMQIALTGQSSASAPCQPCLRLDSIVELAAGLRSAVVQLACCFHSDPSL